ncbi:hypothetical protein PAMP_009810 [Pampus punctatissimus]
MTIDVVLWTRELRTMGMFNRSHAQIVAVAALCVIVFYFIEFNFHNCPEELTVEVPITSRFSPSPIPPPGQCTCPKGSVFLRDRLPEEHKEELIQRRAKELQQHKARTTSVLSRLLFALPNSPLRYPIQGFIVRPLTAALIPGLALYAAQRDSYKVGMIPQRQQMVILTQIRMNKAIALREKEASLPAASLCIQGRYSHDKILSGLKISRCKVSLSVSKGILTTKFSAEGVTVQGDGETELTVESNSLEVLNNLLSNMFYTSTVYHIHTGDLVSFTFENHEAWFPIIIKQPKMPVLYDMGTDISSHVTITTKTFVRYPQLKVLLSSIRLFYSNIKVIIADDSFKPEKITGENIQHYIMPPAQGWFAGRNLAVSQVTTKYFLWVDDDFVFTEKTKIEKLVEVMEAVPELDMVGGAVQGDQFYFSLIYEEGEDGDGGCLHRKSKMKFHSLPSYPQCSLASGVVNFFLARTDAVQRVGFDPKLQRVAHSEFFMDGLGSLLVATCSHVSIGHQRLKHNNQYIQYRYPPKSDENMKYQLHFFKNYLKCVRFG